MMVPREILDGIHEALSTGNFGISVHLDARAAEKGFRIRDAVRVALEGMPIEWYPDRERVLICDRVDIAGQIEWLHVVVGYAARLGVGLTTAYIPDPGEWEDPPTQRRST